MVGDPSGRTEDRKPADQAKTEWNTTKLDKNLNTFFARAYEYAVSRLPSSKKMIHKPRVVDNKEWLGQLGLLDFLCTAGVHVRLNTMLARERCVNHDCCVESMTMTSCSVYERVWNRIKAFP